MDVVAIVNITIILSIIMEVMRAIITGGDGVSELIISRIGGRIRGRVKGLIGVRVKGMIGVRGRGMIRVRVKGMISVRVRVRGRGMILF
jgi:hypothetical protein